MLKYLLYIFSDRPGSVYCDFVCFLFNLLFRENFQQNLGAMASPSSPKDKFLVNVINPYLIEVKRHPQTLRVEDGVLHKEYRKVPVKEGSTKARLEEVEQEVFKYKKMIERGVEANIDIITELKAQYEKEMKEVWSSMAALETKVFEFQGKIYDLHNQNCEYELSFLRMSAAATCRVLETEESWVDGGPMPWK